MHRLKSCTQFLYRNIKLNTTNKFIKKTEIYNISLYRFNNNSRCFHKNTNNRYGNPLTDILEKARRERVTNPEIEKEIAELEEDIDENNPNKLPIESLLEKMRRLCRLYVETNNILSADRQTRTLLELEKDYFGPISIEVANTFSLLAKIASLQFHVREAIDYQHACIETRTKVLGIENAKNIEFAADWNALGEYQRMTKLLEDARKSFDRAKEIYEENEVKNEEYGATLYNIATIAMDEKKYEEAVQILENVLRLDLKDPIRISAYLCTGNSYINLGEIEKAEEYYKKAIEMLKNAKTRNDLIRLGDTSYSLGVLYTTIGDFENAEKYTIDAVNVYRQTEKVIELAKTLVTLGKIYMEKDPKKAIEIFYEAMQIYNTNFAGSNQKDKAFISTNVAMMYDKLEQYENAFQMHQKAIELSKKEKDPHNHISASCLFNLAKHYSQKGEKQLAGEYLEKAYNAYHEAFPEDVTPEMGNVALELGSYYHSVGNWSKAMSCLVESRDIFIAYTHDTEKMIQSSKLLNDTLDHWYKERKNEMSKNGENTEELQDLEEEYKMRKEDCESKLEFVEKNIEKLQTLPIE